MKSTVVASLTAFAFAAGVQARTFSVKNNCAYTVWPAIFTDLNVGSAKPNQPTGWEQKAGATVSFNVPNDWRSGRIWGRTACNFSSNPGPGSCATGGCNGGLLCDERSGTGVPPASLAEWTLGTNGGADWYDVSLVDGSNIPMAITNNKGCDVASCPADLNPNCPAPLQKSVSGKVVGCRSACNAGISPNPADSSNCCNGSHNTPQTCPPSGVQYYDYFKKACPLSYAYAYDESSGTALHTCDSGKAADYTLTFCP